MIKNNRIHNFRSRANAHAIAVFGTGDSASKVISNIVIQGNDIRNMQTGASASIAINGNVSRWAVDGNYLKNINNIGIDAIGGEGTAPNKTINGRVLPGHLDAARWGWIINTREVPLNFQYRTTGALILQADVQPQKYTGRGGARGDENAIRISRNTR